VVADSRGSSVATIRPQREVTKGSIQIDPAYAYFVIPFTLHKDAHARFCLRIFSEGDLDVRRRRRSRQSGVRESGQRHTESVGSGTLTARRRKNTETDCHSISQSQSQWLA
jgi:hypothetical protein